MNVPSVGSIPNVTSPGACNIGGNTDNAASPKINGNTNEVMSPRSVNMGSVNITSPRECNLGSSSELASPNPCGMGGIPESPQRVNLSIDGMSARGVSTTTITDLSNPQSISIRQEVTLQRPINGRSLNEVAGAAINMPDNINPRAIGMNSNLGSPRCLSNINNSDQSSANLSNSTEISGRLGTSEVLSPRGLNMGIVTNSCDATSTRRIGVNAGDCMSPQMPYIYHDAVASPTAGSVAPLNPSCSQQVQAARHCNCPIQPCAAHRPGSSHIQTPTGTSHRPDARVTVLPPRLPSDPNYPTPNMSMHPTAYERTLEYVEQCHTWALSSSQPSCNLPSNEMNSLLDENQYFQIIQ